MTPDQIAFYRDNGYLVVEAVFGPAELAQLRRVTAEFVAAARQAPASNAVYDLAPEHCRERPAVRRIKNPQDRYPVYAAAARGDRLVDLVADLLGPAVRFDHGKLNIKPAGGGAAIEWHQDWAFYPHTNDDLLAVGIMLEDCTAEMGPLSVIPGSHKGPVHDHHHEGSFVGALDPADLGPARETAVALTGRAGAGRARSTTCARCMARGKTWAAPRGRCWCSATPRSMPGLWRTGSSWRRSTAASCTGGRP